MTSKTRSERGEASLTTRKREALTTIPTWRNRWAREHDLPPVIGKHWRVNDCADYSTLEFEWRSQLEFLGDLVSRKAIKKEKGVAMIEFFSLVHGFTVRWRYRLAHGSLYIWAETIRPFPPRGTKVWEVMI